MELKDYIENFAAYFDDTDASEIKAETIFKELDDWSSLIALSMITMAVEEYVQVYWQTTLLCLT